MPKMILLMMRPLRLYLFIIIFGLNLFLLYRDFLCLGKLEPLEPLLASDSLN
jgi:hypothetical protein